MRKITKKALSKCKYFVLITMVVFSTAFFAYKNVFDSFAYITNSSAVTITNSKSGDLDLTRWDKATDNHGYVNFGLFPKTEVYEKIIDPESGMTTLDPIISEDNPVYTYLQNQAHYMDHYLYNFSSTIDNSPLTYSPVVKYEGNYYIKDKAGSDEDIWFKMEPITWRILNVDTTNNKVLLFADSIVEARRWDDDTNTLTKWSDTPDIVTELNGDYVGDSFYNTSFYNKAFSPAEKNYIKSDKNDYSYSDRDGSDVSLNVRLLSSYEMFNYTSFNGYANYGFASTNGATGEASNRLGIPTNYAVKGASSEDIAMIEGYSTVTMKYLTRGTLTESGGAIKVQTVNCNGSANGKEDYDRKLGVRPVITVDLNFFKNEMIYGTGTKDDPYYANLTYDINYNLGDADDGSVPSSSTINSGESVTLSSTELEREDENVGHVIFDFNDGVTSSSNSYVTNSFEQNGWTTSLGGEKVYDLGEEITPTSDLELYPSWSVTTSPALFPVDPEREGYEFKEWNTKSDGTGSKVTSYQGSSSPYNLYAIWIPNTYKNTIKFVLNGGSGTFNDINQDVTYPNTKYSFNVPSTIPAKNGYTFDGWYNLPYGGNKYVSTILSGADNFAGDQTTYVYAHWTRTTVPKTEVELLIDPNGGTYEGLVSKTYDVHKHDGDTEDGGECYEPVYHEHSESCYTDHVHTESCYSSCTNNLWVISSEIYTGTGSRPCYLKCTVCGFTYQKNVDSGYPVGRTLTIYKAHSNPNPTCGKTDSKDLICEFKNYSSGQIDIGNIDSYVMNCDKNEFQVISDPVRTGYTFNSWSSNTSYNTYDDGGVTKWKGDSDTVLTANYTANTYEVSFSSDDGQSYSSIQVTFDEKYGTLPQPSKTGYNFEGWHCESTGGSLVTKDTLVKTASNHTLYARFSPKVVTVSFNRHLAGDNPESISAFYGSAYGTLPSVSETGYTFDGWYTSETGGSKVTSETLVTNESNHTLHAHFSANTYEVKYNKGDATSDTVPASQTVTFDQNLTLASNAMTKSDTASGFTVSYNMGNATSGTLPDNTTQTFSYAPNGWATSQVGSKVYESGYTFSPYKLTSGLELYPAWSVSKNKVTLATNNLVRGDTNTSTVTFKYQDSQTSDETRIVTRTYTANGWSTSQDGSKVYDDGEELTESSNLSLYPSFSFVDNNISFPSDPTRTGYTFKEWNTKSDGTGSKVTSYNGTSDLTLYAIWEGIKYTNTLVYDVSSNGGSNGPSNDSKVVTYPNTKSSHTLSSVVPTKEGYNFVGWFDDPSSGNQISSPCEVGNNEVSSNQEKTIYAHFEKNKYAVNFKSKDKSADLFTQMTLEYGDQIGDIYQDHIPSLDGYLFGGWYLDSDTNYANKITSSYVVNKNITLVPRWYKVNFDKLQDTYDGNSKSPVISVVDDKAQPSILSDQTDYSVSDTGDKINSGTRNITVTGNNSNGIYGSVTKTFTINKVVITKGDVVISNYNNSDNTVKKEFDLNDKSNKKILASNIELCYASNHDVKFNFDLDSSFYDSANPDNTNHKDITLSNVRINQSFTSNYNFVDGGSNITFEDYGMIVDKTSPVISNLEIISSQNIYGLGQEIIFKLETNEELVKNGDPNFKLLVESPSGTSMGDAVFDSSNASNNNHTFIFKYLVKDSDNGINGKLKLTPSISGGNLADNCGNALNTALDNSNQNIKDIQINTSGFIITSSMNPDILASETTTSDVVSVTYDLSGITLKAGYSLDTLINELEITKEVSNSGVKVNIKDDNAVTAITKDENGTNKKVIVTVNTESLIDSTNRDGITLTFKIPSEVLVNDIDNKNIESLNEIRILRNLNDSDIIVKHDGNVLDHIGTIYRAYENDVIEVLLNGITSGVISYDGMPNTVITKLTYKFTNFVLSKTNWASSLPFDIEFAVRGVQDLIDDVNNIITDLLTGDSVKESKLKEILENSKDLKLLDPKLSSDEAAYILSNASDVSKIFIEDNNTALADDDELAEKLRDAISKDKQNKTVTPSTRKKKINVKEEDVVIDEKGEEKVITHVSYLVGYEDGTIRPEGFITRGEMASLISHLSSDYDKEVNYASDGLKFKDVNPNAWNASYLGFLAKENIYEGYEDLTVRPSNNITRGEFSKSICILFGLDVNGLNTNSKHIFKDSKGKWYEEYVNTLWEYGYIEGYEDGSFRGNDPIKRAEACAIINRVLNRTIKNSDTLLDEERLEFESKFKDIKNKWYYYDLFEATMSY